MYCVFVTHRHYISCLLCYYLRQEVLQSVVFVGWFICSLVCSFTFGHQLKWQAGSGKMYGPWLDQKSVRHCGWTAYGPFSIVGSLSAPHRTLRLRHLSTLQWCWWDGRTSGVTLPSTRPGAAGVMAKSPLSKRLETPMELPGEDRGGDPSPRPGMRERKYGRLVAFCMLDGGGSLGSLFLVVLYIMPLICFELNVQHTWCWLQNWCFYQSAGDLNWNNVVYCLDSSRHVVLMSRWPHSFYAMNVAIDGR